MNKLIEFGNKTLFYARLLSGYEERRIRSFRLGVEKRLKEEAQIEEYFKLIDKEAEMIMKTQLEGEERTMKEMMKAMHQQALLEKTEAEKEAQKKLETDQKSQESRPKSQHLPPAP